MEIPQRTSGLIVTALLLAVGTAVAQTPETDDDSVLLRRYCIACHNDRTLTAGVSVQGVDLEHVGEHAEVTLWRPHATSRARRDQY